METQSAVVLIIFNRPEKTESVLAEIARARPAKLFVVADGPRPGNPDDPERCRAAREVIDSVNWPCEVVRNFSDVNIGCGYRIASGLSWVFEQVDRAIVLEDDCVPSQSFFRFCDEMLDRYAADERVMMVSGNNMLPNGGGMENDYTFFRCLSLWGWATWKRAWHHFDFELNSWPRLQRAGLIEKLFDREPIRAYWKDIFDEYYLAQHRRDVWDYHFTYALLSREGLGIAPRVNLVSNVGWGPDATHTFGDSKLANLPAGELTFPIRHPGSVAYDAAFDRLVFDEVFARPVRRKRGRRRDRARQAVVTRLPLELRRWCMNRGIPM